MGVLRMAIPSAGIFPRLKRADGRAGLRGGTLLPLAEATPLQTPQRTPRNSQRPRVEARLIRTPEQEAAQEAAGRLVRRCVAGDPQAWQQLVVSQHRRIYAICYRFTGSATDAEDLTQEVFLKLYRNLASFDVERGSFQTWITTLARNLLVDHFRRTRLERASDSLDASFSGDDEGATLAALELEHYPGMAEEEISRVMQEAQTRWPLMGATAIHRYGKIARGARRRRTRRGWS